MTTPTAPPLVFLHIPKTAGTSVLEMLTRAYGPDATERLTDPTRFPTELRRAIKSKRVVTGHLPFASLEPYLTNIRAFTLLREPVARVISLYDFWRNSNESTITTDSEAVSVRCAKRLSLPDFVQCRHPVVEREASNGMAKMLLSQSTAPLTSDAALFQAAQANLDRILFAPVERLDNWLEVLGDTTGTYLSGDVSLNVGSRREDDRITDRVRLDVIERNLADVLLYDYSVATFQRRYANHIAQKRFHAVGPSALSTLIRNQSGTYHWSPNTRLYGSNWHELEVTADGTSYRFTGGGATSIYFPNVVANLACSIRIHILFFAKDHTCLPLEACHIRVNDYPVAHEVSLHRPGGAELVVPLEARQTQGDILKVTLDSDYAFVPSAVLPTSPDSRSLFAAISSIGISAT